MYRSPGRELAKVLPEGGVTSASRGGLGTGYENISDANASPTYAIAKLPIRGGPNQIAEEDAVYAVANPETSVA